MIAPVELNLDVKDKRIVVKIPKKYCSLKSKINMDTHKSIIVTTGGFGSPIDEAYQYVIDMEKLNKDGFDSAIWLEGELEDCMITAVPNEVDDYHGVLIKDKDKITLSDIYKWATGKEYPTEKGKELN